MKSNVSIFRHKEISKQDLDSLCLEAVYTDIHNSLGNFVKELQQRIEDNSKMIIVFFKSLK
jgi:hypothetical protein